MQYLPYDAAATSGLISNASDSIYLGVDHANTYPIGGPGRPSVRLESKQTFTEGLFVLDLSHIPVGCGTWPAFWTVGLGDWPADGEIGMFPPQHSVLTLMLVMFRGIMLTMNRYYREC